MTKVIKVFNFLQSQNVLRKSTCSVLFKGKSQRMSKKISMTSMRDKNIFIGALLRTLSVNYSKDFRKETSK